MRHGTGEAAVTQFDYVAIAVLIVSGLIGLARGGAREVITIIAFLLAVLAAAYGLRFTGPAARHALHPAVLANAVAILVVFALVYGVLRLIGSRLISRFFSGKAVTSVDRVIGVAFGLLRGVLALGVFYLAFNAATPPERVPSWMKDAALYPLSRSVGRVLMGFAPRRAFTDQVGQDLGDETAGPSSRASDRQRGYDAQSREGVDELVEKAR
jgi:membrane protein required for colicin V production